MFFHIKVSSKNKKMLKNFVQFLLKLESTSHFLKFFSKKNARKFVTVLKSPHVNKTAQEQFEFRFHTKEFILNSFKPLTFFLILKKTNNLSLSGVNLKIKSLFKENKILTAVNPDNTYLNIVKNYGLTQKRSLKRKISNKRNFQQLNKSFSQRYIQLFDCYGEIFLKNNFYLK